MGIWFHPENRVAREYRSDKGSPPESPDGKAAAKVPKSIVRTGKQGTVRI